ncbi:hypothetical protein [Nonomuraea sp. NPDC048826]|uniref:hypothetical protein n=1 Tax=Nonomuraea sp. NPDC048826 TaxID=3364347 RepID=UPI00371A4701
MNRTSEVEDALRRTLRHAADQAPELLSGAVSSQVELRYRRRRNRTRALLAAAAVLVIAGGAAGGLRAAGQVADRAATAPDTTAADATATALTSAEPSPAPTYAPRPGPVESVWPQALREVPAKTPEGRAIEPLLLLDDRTMLVSTSASFEKADALYAYDLDDLSLRKIADVVTPAGTTLFASGFDVAEGHIAWWTQLGDGTAQIWAVPLDGGTAEIIGSLRSRPDSGLDKVEIVGDRVAFSVSTGGVYTVPLKGGAVEAVEDGAGMHLLSWPWIGAPGPYGAGPAPFSLIRDVETGATDQAVIRHGEELTACGVTLCVGSYEGAGFYRSRDGSGQKELPGGVERQPPAGDRFHVSVIRYGERSVGVVLVDLKTGASADLGIKPKFQGGGMSIQGAGFDADGRGVIYRIGDTLRVIDVTKIT